MKIIILGAGKVGAYLTSDLSNEGHDIVVIEKDKEILRHLSRQNDVMGIVGDGRDIETLREASVGDADVFIAITANDDVNLISSIFAKNLGAKHTLARVRDINYVKESDFIANMVGADKFVNPEYLTANDIQRELTYVEANNVEGFFDDRLRMIEITIDEKSELANKSLVELSRSGIFSGNIISLVVSEDEIIVPTGNYVLKPGDRINIAGRNDNVRKFYREVTRDDAIIKNVLIIGASNTGYYLAKMLIDRKFNVTVIEIDRKKAEDFQERLEDAVVYNADGSNPDILEEVRIRDFDALVSLTGIDEENILISLLGNKYGVPKTIAKVNRPELLRTTGILDIDYTITPKKTASDFINMHIRSKKNSRGRSIVNLFTLEDNEIELIEFKAIEDSHIIGKKVKDLSIKSNTLLVSILRDNTKNIEIVTGESVINLGDSILVVTKQKNLNVLEDVLN